MKTIEWNLTYYFRGIPSWDWHYPHNYAPFVSDLLQFPRTGHSFVVGEPASPLTHLLAILPPTSGDQLLPSALHGITSSELKEFYPIQYEVDHRNENRVSAVGDVVILPFVQKVIGVLLSNDNLMASHHLNFYSSKATLSAAVAKKQAQFTPEESSRDKFGQIIKYEYVKIDNDGILDETPVEPEVVSDSESSCF